MPLGFERLNERTQRPNALINFIRTRPGPTSHVAEQILNRVAAICYPFMKANTILVQALEEFPYNNEFVGRNFNAGEVIQLVLRDKQGRWLPQRMVEMVMVHELAHCKQMNHSKAFWKVRDAYAGDLRALWGKGYTGEGLWSRGRDLVTGAVQMGEDDVADVPEHLCGGTYGRRARKRRRGGKEKPTLSHAERKQRRILKKFGVGGQSLGADDDAKVKLEGGVPKKGKPRVAGSARGRDLRAAAALARFDTAKKEDVTSKKEEILSDSETEDEFVEGDQEGAAVDVDGTDMLDDKGCALVRICEDEDDKDDNAKRELAEIQGFAPQHRPSSKPAIGSNTSIAQKSNTKQAKSDEGNLRSNQLRPTPSSKQPLQSPPARRNDHPDRQRREFPETFTTLPLHYPSQSPAPAHPSSCPLCSFQNDFGSLTCGACSNVLDPRLVPNHWRCTSNTCAGSEYINAGDAGVCGVCGTSRKVA